MAKTFVSGYVRDAQTGEKLIGAYVVEQGSTNGTSTDMNAYFNLALSGKVLQVSFVGYQPQTIRIERDTLLVIYLESANEIETIDVEGQSKKRFNVTTLNARQINSIPAIGGKPDVIKTLQLLPGIQTQKEGTSLMNVRGGNPGENLYLIDNVPLIYMNHLGGFTSVFNPDMINSVQVYKGGFPAKYGGKLSSVVAISQREGNRDHLKGTFGIGLSDGSFTVEGPINEQWSFIVNGRKTLSDALFIAVSSLADQDYIIRYGFHDINAKLTWRPDNKNSLSFNLYQGDDYLHFLNKRNLQKEDGRNEIQNIWGNWLASARWTNVLSPKLVADNTLSLSRYRLKINQDYKHEVDSMEFIKENVSSVQEVRFSSDWIYKINKTMSLNFGIQNATRTYIPNKYQRSDYPLSPDFETIHTNEGAVYLNNQLVFSNFVEANIGARMVGYTHRDFFDYSFEPRISINVQFAKKHALNFTYQNVKQYAHLLFASGSILNNEIWVPASEQFRPSQSSQYSVGIKGSMLKDLFQHEISFYYKDLRNLSTYREGYMNFLGDGGWRTKIETNGKGLSYGAEFLLRKLEGKWTGFVGYTYSKTTRQYPGINRGKEFLFDYHRLHAVALNVNRKLNDKWDFGMNWVYHTGLPYTPVLGRQAYVDGAFNGEALIYGERNSATVKAYHRLDLALTLHTYTKRGRKAQWNFSVYNAYNRNNAFNYLYLYSKSISSGYHQQEGESLKLYQQGMFPIIPTVTYKVFFDPDLKVPVQQTTYRSLLKNMEKTTNADFSIEDKWNINLGYAMSPSLKKKNESGMYRYFIFPKLSADLNYRLSAYWSAGSYWGVQRYRAYVLDEGSSTSGSIYNKNALLAGVQSKFIYSEFIPSIRKLVDLYASASVGFKRYQSGNYYWPRGFRLCYGVKSGASVFFSKHLGAFVEYGIDIFESQPESELKYGLSIRF
ncbi:TonB-dependent receptor [Roseimarinus sediminis]|uniref:TonB-dependent receptor n=1 Tax=Roseimarinus sediminis TaxID=1610899 RepID=UPI003D1E2244